MPLPFEEVQAKIDAYRHISILTHINPDADTLGTALGIYALLAKQKDKKLELVNASDALPKYLDFLPNYKKIKSKMDYKESLIISCDCASIDRLGFDLTGRDILNIDHHQSNTGYGKVNIIMPSYASASQVAYALFKEIYPITAEVATCFYTALFYDTQYFSTSSVNAEVFALANDLVKLGANPQIIAQNFRQRRSLASLRILQRALDSLTLLFDARVAILSISQEDILATGASMADMEGIVEYGKSLATVEISIFLLCFSDDIRVSLRSKGADVSKVAVAFGGGGHKLASGFTLKQCNLKESIDTILNKIIRLRIINETKKC